LSGWQVASFRSGVAALAVLVFMKEARRGWSGATALVGLGYAATLTLFVLSNKLTTSANAIFLQATAPLYLVLLGPWLLKEPLRRRDVVFMAVLVVGLGLFFVGTEPPRVTAPDPVRGNLLAIASGLCWACTVAGLRWVGRREAQGSGSAIAAVAAGNLIAFAVGLPFAWPVAAVGAADVAAIAYLGVFQIGLAYVALTKGLRHVPAFEAALLLSIEPVLNPVWAWIVHGEMPSAPAIAGGVVILAATIAHQLADGAEAMAAASESRASHLEFRRGGRSAQRLCGRHRSANSEAGRAGCLLSTVPARWNRSNSRSARKARPRNSSVTAPLPAERWRRSPLSPAGLSTPNFSGSMPERIRSRDRDRAAGPAAAVLRG